MNNPDDIPADDMEGFLQAFLDETNEELETLVQSLLILEQDPDERSALNESFRMVHSLKGSSGMMGYEKIADLAHRLESLFDSIREGKAVLNRTAMDVVLECIDYFRDFISRLQNGDASEGDITPLVGRLESLNEIEVTAESGKVNQPAIPGLMTLGAGFRIRVTFQKGLPLADLKAKLILTRLTNIGEIVGSEPSIDDIKSFDDLQQFVVIVATESHPDEVRSVVDVDGVDSIEFIDQCTSTQADDDEDSDVVKGENELQNESQPKASEKVEAEAKTSSKSEELSETQLPFNEPNTELDVESEPALNDVGPGNVSSITQDSQPEPSNRQRIAETVRVDIGRLDRLMNLTGELVVTNARLSQMLNQVTPSLKNKKEVRRTFDAIEAMSGILEKINTREESQQDWTRDENWHKELNSNLAVLKETTEHWTEGNQHLASLKEATDQLNRVSKNLQKGVLDTRMVPVGPLFNRFKRVIRDLSNDRGKKVQLIIGGENTELDKRMVDELGDPLLHLIRNCIDHGIESPEQRSENGKTQIGTIQLEASHSGNNVFVIVKDDGAGIDIEKVRNRLVQKEILQKSVAAELTDQQVIDHIWTPGFSTAEKVTDISGRGVGMDIVKNHISDLNGSIEVTSNPGNGTTFELRLPLTLAIVRSLIVRVRETCFTIPIDDIREIISVSKAEIVSVQGNQTVEVRGVFVPFSTITDLFRWKPSATISTEISHAEDAIDSQGVKPENRQQAEINIVIVQSSGRTLGLKVDELLGSTDVVIKSLSDNFKNVDGLSGASIMGDGSVSLMLDTAALISMVKLSGTHYSDDG